MRYFGSSGIRGIYGEKITQELAFNLGRAICMTGKKDIAVARDTRISGELLEQSLFSGLSGCSISSFGIIPTPALCFGTRLLKKDAGVMITASHNPSEYNGFKLWNNEGRAYSRKQEEEVEGILSSKKFISGGGNKSIEEHDVSREYLDAIESFVSLSGKMKVMIDSGNGAAFRISPLLLKRYNYDFLSINDTPDGRFPKRNPEPTASNLMQTSALSRQNNCDICFCHDGDADRVIPIDDKGNTVNFDKFMVFVIRGMMEETGIKRVVTTVDASSLVDDYLEDAKVFRTKVGDVFVANKCEEANSCIGAEPAGVFIFPKFGLWPDGIFASAKTLNFLEEEKRKLSEILAEMPDYFFERNKLFCPEDKKDIIMEEIESAVPEDAELLTIDGLRARLNEHTVLIRPSGTEPIIRINVEAKSKMILDEKMKHWYDIVKKAIGEAK
ncbi:phosphoglucosamine mutase [Candidatus Woesearchaeota archaeon]|nr:phosphoglucosamine mutase [Candidatus Woesearchaeota archaeon]